MQLKLFYIGFYTIPGILPERSVSLAARNKMEYTIEVLKESVKDIEIISPATTKLGEYFSFGEKIKITKNITLKLFPTLPSKNKLFLFFNRKFVNLCLLFYLLFSVSSGDIVLAYHSLVTSKIISFAKKVKGFKLILEVNEIYSDVSPEKEKYRASEIQSIKEADAYIFPNSLMNKIFNPLKKPFLIEHGIYKTNKNLISKFNDEKIHIVYAGTFEIEKGGVMTAIKVAEYLPKQYHLHILGFGTPNEITKVKDAIKNITSNSDCIVSYDGILEGKAFNEFLQKCHIGLSTQVPGLKYNDTSFPSKILTYLSNGLQVVSIKIPAITESKLAKNLFLYKENSPEIIADVIKSIHDFSPKFGLLESLDEDFRKGVKELLNLL